MKDEEDLVLKSRSEAALGNEQGWAETVGRATGKDVGQHQHPCDTSTSIRNRHLLSLYS